MAANREAIEAMRRDAMVQAQAARVRERLRGGRRMKTGDEPAGDEGIGPVELLPPQSRAEPMMQEEAGYGGGGIAGLPRVAITPQSEADRAVANENAAWAELL